MRFMKERILGGIKAAVPTVLGYISIGLACGIIGSPYDTCGLMHFCYAGKRPVAMLALIAVQAPVAAIAMTVFLINLRLFAELACVDLFPSYQSLAKYRYV